MVKKNYDIEMGQYFSDIQYRIVPRLLDKYKNGCTVEGPQFSIYILRETEYIIMIQFTIITYSHNSRTPGANLWPWF